MINSIRVCGQVYVVILFACALLSVSCSKSKAESQEGERQSIRLGVMPSMDCVPFWVAKKYGIYDSLKLNLEVVSFFSANDRDATLQSGNIDGAIIDFMGAVLQQANGIPLRLIMKTDGEFFLIAHQSFETKEIQQLQSIAIAHNTVIEYAMDYMFRRKDLPIENVKKVEISKIPIRLEMLNSKQVDASIFPEPFASMAINEGHHKFFSFSDVGMNVTGLVFFEKLLEEKQAAVKLLIEGYNQAVDRICNDLSREELEKIVAEELRIPIADLTGKISLPSYTKASLPSESNLSEVVSWVKQKGLISETYNMLDLLDSSFVTSKTR